MRRAGLLDDAAEAEVKAAADQKVGAAVTAFEATSAPDPEDMFRYVFAEPTPALVEQQAQLAARPDEGS
jgi:pyruvate dehydrogenase E1 component alpha subunit